MSDTYGESEWEGIESQFWNSEAKWLSETSGVPPSRNPLFPFVAEEVKGEWEGEGNRDYDSFFGNALRHSSGVDDCECDPCVCDTTDGGVNEDDGTRDLLNKKKVENYNCFCNPCECTTPPEEPKLPEHPSSCVNCCKNNALCTCVHEEVKKEDDVVTIPDPLDEFVRKLENTLISNQKRFCRSLFPKYKNPRVLTDGMVFDLLVKDTNGKSIVYLPGSQLCPKIIRRLIDEDMIIISSVLMEHRSIATVSIPYNDVGDRGLNIIADALLECKNVEHLNIMNNEITAAGIMALGQKLMTRPPLLTLRLSGNKFGNEGFEALSCLVLSGHVPHDLDVSETDMGVEGFQSFCAALMALDHDEDYPPHYITREKNLPIDLDILKQFKIEYNEKLRKIEVVTSHKTEAFDLYQTTPDKWKEIKNVCIPPPEKIHPVPQILSPEVIGKFSATVLQTLYNISQKTALESNETDDAATIVKLRQDYPFDEVMTIMDTALTQDDLEEIKIALDQERKPRQPARVINYRDIPILNKNMYKIESSKDVEHEFLHDVDKPEILSLEGQGQGQGQGDPGVPFLFHGQLIDTTASILTKDKPKIEDFELTLTQQQPMGLATDEYTADNAAKKFLQRSIRDAAASVAISKVDDQSDVVQLVLMTIVEIVYRGQQTGKLINLSIEDYKLITEEAMERVMRLLEAKAPIGCELSEEMIRLFIQSLFQGTEHTFRKLLQNPLIMNNLREKGTLSCHVQRICDQNKTPMLRAPPPKIQFLVSKFIDGILEEAGHIIGTGDPFSYRQLPNKEYLKGHDEHDLRFNITCKNSDPILTFVQDIFKMGESVAGQANEDSKEVHQARQDYTQAAEFVIRDLFEHTQDFVEEREKIEAEKHGEDEETNEMCLSHLIYRYVSRPTRLVLNRPLFHPGHVEVMAMMLGDYIKDNCSVKELHIQKWQLNEDGMLAFMERVMENRTLVLLDISNNELGADGVKHLAEYITLNPNLKHVILNHNRIRDPGITHIAKTIGQSSLESLNVAFNDLTQVGLDLLLTQIPLTKVTALYLWGNSFGFKTWKLWKSLLEDKLIEYTDTLVDSVDGIGCMVKNSQVRDTNFWYDVPPVPKRGKELIVPPYLMKSKKSVNARVKVNLIEENEAEG